MCTYNFLEMDGVKFSELDDNAATILMSSNCLSVLDQPKIILRDIKPFLQGRTIVKTSEFLDYIENQKKVISTISKSGNNNTCNELHVGDNQKTVTKKRNHEPDNSSRKDSSSKDVIVNKTGNHHQPIQSNSIPEQKFLRSAKNKNTNNDKTESKKETDDCKIVVVVLDDDDDDDHKQNDSKINNTSNFSRSRNKRKYPFNNNQVNTATATTTITTITKNKKRKMKKPQQENMKPVEPVLDEKDTKSDDNNIDVDVTDNNNDTQVPCEPILCLVEKQLETGVYYLTSQEGNRLQLMQFNGHTLEFITPL